jgi:hypothetical protein
LGGVVIGVRREEDLILPDRDDHLLFDKYIKMCRQFDANIKATKSQPL